MSRVSDPSLPAGRAVLRTETPRHGQRAWGLVGACLVAPILACLPVSPAAADTTTYTSPGTYTYQVPPGTSTIVFLVAGSQGSGGGGSGGTVAGLVSVTPGSTLTIDVGGYADGTDYLPGGRTQNCWGQCYGGGASAIRGYVIAGGGGARGGNNSGEVYAGGDGGYPAGTPGAGLGGGGGGTQSGPGAGGSGGGYSGNGGAGGNSNDVFFGPERGGGGGGGYYGGGGGGGDGGGGGGGSSWVSPSVVAPQFCNGCQADTGQVTITAGSLATSSTIYASDDCASGTAWSDGFVNDFHVRVRTVQPDANTTWVCVRADGQNSERAGGKFVVKSPAGNAAAPTVDSNAGACSTAAGNTVPGPHPALSAAVGDPSDPTTYLPVLLDSYSSSTATWVCVGIASVRQRVIVGSNASAMPPEVTFVPDAAGAPRPTTAAPSLPSGTCQAAGGSRYLDMTTVQGTRVFLYALARSSTEMQVCVRIDGAVKAGGVLTVGSNSVSGAIPVVTTSTSDTSPCTIRIAHVDSPALLDVSRSSGTGVPASACVTIGTTHLRVTVTSLGGGVPSPGTVASWTPDA